MDNWTWIAREICVHLFVSICIIAFHETKTEIFRHWVNFHVNQARKVQTEQN